MARSIRINRPAVLSQSPVQQITAEVLNEEGSARETAANGPITLRIGSTNQNAAVLGGTLTRTAVNGIATFDDLTFSKSGKVSLVAESSDVLLGLPAPAFAGGHTIDADTVVRVRFANNGAGRTVPVDDGPNAIPFSMVNATNLAFTSSFIGDLHVPPSGAGKFPGPTVYAEATPSNSAPSRAGLLGEMTLGLSLVVPKFSRTFGDTISFYGGTGRFVVYLWRNDGITYKIDWYYDTGTTPATCGTGSFAIPNNVPVRVLFVRRLISGSSYECCGYVNGVLIQRSTTNQILPASAEYTNGRWRVGTLNADANSGECDMAEFFLSKRAFTAEEVAQDARNCGVWMPL